MKTELHTNYTNALLNFRSTIMLFFWWKFVNNIEDIEFEMI